MDAERRRYRAGEKLDDLCRACKMERGHTVIVADPEGMPLRVICDHCGSQHNYRGGPRPEPARPARESRPPMEPTRESGGGDLESLVRRVIREEAGLTPVAPADRWRGGEVVLRPGRPGLQEKTMPIDTFFHKIVMLRNRLRTLEQQVNASDLPSDTKLKLQGYVTACYGSLTSFNVLFADEEDRFRGSGSKD